MPVMLRFFAAMLALSALTSALATEDEVQTLLAKMRKAYQNVGSVSLQGRSRVRYSEGEESHSFTLDYARPAKLRLVFDFRGKTIRRVSDGERVYTWVAEAKASEKPEPDIAKISMDALGGEAPINLESMSFFDWKRQLSTTKGANMEKSELKVVPEEKWNGKEWVVLEEMAHGQGVFARYFIDPKTFFIWRCEVRTLDKKSFFMDTQVLGMKLNPSFGDGTFKAPFQKP